MSRIQAYDAIIVGGGGSGLAAAHAVAERGGRVVVLEKQPQLGGTTGIAIGSFTASATRLQQVAGIADDPVWHAEDAGKFAPAEFEARNNASLRRYFLRQTAATLEWLQGLGLSFYGPSPEPPNRVPRMHNVVPGAKAYIAALQIGVQRLGGQIHCNCPVVELLAEAGRIVGVRAEINGRPSRIYAKLGVVLAAGDYAAASDLIGQHKGPQFSAIEAVNPYATGDGHRLAGQAGAVLVNMDITYGPELRFVPPCTRPFEQLLPAGTWSAKVLGTLARLLPKTVIARLIKRLLVTWQHPENALFEDGAILVNKEGRRFTNERECPQREIDLASQTDRICYILLDGRLAGRYSAEPHYISTAPQIAYAYVQDYQRLRPDITQTANTLDQLAQLAGVDAAGLSETIACFNRYVSGAQPDRFGRKGDNHLMQRPPWVLLGPAKAYFTTTEGGVMVNECLQVLDASGRPIPGLYAVGQNGLGGMVLWGHGLHIAWALTSGRLAGNALMDQHLVCPNPDKYTSCAREPGMS